MSPIPDDFEQLRRLLALKRHEQPPPGYFHGFSRQVIVRIKAGDLGGQSEASSFWSFSGGSFLQRLWATLDARPVLAGAFGVAVCGFFVVGAVLSDATANQGPPTSPHIQIATGQATPVLGQPIAVPQVASLVGEPPSQPQGSLFQEIEEQQRRLVPAFQQVRPSSPQQVDFRLLAHP
jgi:hypothetical protein